MSILSIGVSYCNYNNPDSIVAEVTGDVKLKVEDIITLLMEHNSQNLAKLINTLGKIYNKPESSGQLAQACSIDDIDADGKEFIENMNYFLKANIERKVTKKMTGGES